MIPGDAKRELKDLYLEIVTLCLFYNYHPNEWGKSGGERAKKLYRRIRKVCIDNGIKDEELARIENDASNLKVINEQAN